MIPGNGGSTYTYVPAHDLMGEQDSAHFRILVLSLVDDGLKKRDGRQIRNNHVVCPLHLPLTPCL